MALRPASNQHKALLSTTSRLLGEFASKDMLIAHAWAGFGSQAEANRYEQGPASRSTYVFAFQTPPEEQQGVRALPDYAPTADAVCNALSLLFGKRFDNHGLFEGTGQFLLPDFRQLGTLCIGSLPHNSHQPRTDYSVPLNLVEVHRLAALFAEDAIAPLFHRTFHASAKFYASALRITESDPEIAYLHLITALEILSGHSRYPKESLMDTGTRDLLDQIRASCADGDRLARQVASKVLLIKRQLVRTVLDLVDPDFFSHPECPSALGALKQTDFETTISAAYDLRSHYVHTGSSFGYWVFLGASGPKFEVQVGRPVVEGKSFAKALAHAPTFIGLERIVRHCLLRFAVKNGAYQPKGTCDA